MHRALRFSSPLLTFTSSAAVVLFSVRVSVAGEKLIRNVCVLQRNWWTNSVGGTAPLWDLFTVLFYEGYFLLQWKWWISFVCGNSWTSIVQGSAVQDTLVGKCRQLAGSQRKVLLEVSLGNDDSRKWKFDLLQVVMSTQNRFTFIQIHLQASLITDILQAEFRQVSNCWYGSFLSGKNVLGSRREQNKLCWCSISLSTIQCTAVLNSSFSILFYSYETRRNNLATFLNYKLFRRGNMSLCVYFEVPLTPWGSL